MMPDLKTRFRGADRIPAPHQWQEITSREPSPHTAEPSAARRILVAAFALAIAVAGISFTIHAFRGGNARPTPGGSPQPIEPKANGLISFQNGSSEGGIWTDTIEPDGSGRQTVFGRDQDVSRVTWSSDGTRIAYVKLVQGSSRSTDGKPHWGIFTANPDGTNARELTRGVNDGWPAWLTWSPDGSRIAFSNLGMEADAGSCTLGGDATCPTDIYVMDANGTSVSRLTADALGAYQPSWSPDGTQITFVRQVNPPDSTLTGIFVMNADGSDVRKIASTTHGSDFAPSWSPDGSEVMYGSIRSEDWGIFVVNADGTGERPIFDKGPYVDDPVWSPDGTMVAFVGDPGITGAGSDSALFVMRADGTGITKLADTPRYGVDGGIAWQPLPSGSPSPSPELAGTARVTATIPLPADSTGGGLSVGAGSLWSGLNDTHGRNGAVLRIDPATNEIVATVAVAEGPSRKRIAATDNAVWVASTGLLQRIDPATNSVVASVAIPDRSISAVAADSSDVWAVTIGADGGVLVRVDTATNAIVAEVPLGSQITGYEDEVKIGAGSVWVIGVGWIERENAEYGSDLIRVDPASNTVVSRIPVGGFRMAVGPDAVWVTFPADGVFNTSGERWLWTKVDVRTNEASQPFRFQAVSLALVTPDGLWSVDYDDQEFVRVTRSDPATLAVVSRSEPVRSYFHDAVLDPTSATVWVATLNAIVRLDIA